MSEADTPLLRRELSLWEAIGLSLALMAPSMAVNINPQGMVGSVGRAIPLAFILATVSVLIVAYTFVRLTTRFRHAGSVYGFVGATLGPRAGVIAGWGLVGTYLFFGVATSLAFGRFTTSVIADLTGTAPNDTLAIGISVAGVIPVLLLALWPARLGTRILLVIEAITVGLILIVGAVVLVKLAGHDAPEHLGIDFSVFSPAPGGDLSSLFLGVVFGFLSFAGFEAASTLGEETRNPRRDIPRAILGVTIFGGIYFVFVTAFTVMGFGADDDGLNSMTQSNALVGELGARYVAPWMGEFISAGAAISALGCMLACCVGAARLIYALGRDGIRFGAFGKVHARRGTPTYATLAVAAAILVVLLTAFALLRGDMLKSWQDATGFTDAPPTLAIFTIVGTAGTLILLVVYSLATLGVLVMAKRDGSIRVHQVVVPVLGLGVLAYTLFRNVVPFPSGAGWWAPCITVAWLLTGVVWVAVRADATRRAGLALLHDEGLAESNGSTPTQGERVAPTTS